MVRDVKGHFPASIIIKQHQHASTASSAALTCSVISVIMITCRGCGRTPPRPSSSSLSGRPARCAAPAEEAITAPHITCRCTVIKAGATHHHL